MIENFSDNFKRGRHDRNAGIKQCPYPEGSESASVWQHGWDFENLIISGDDKVKLADAKIEKLFIEMKDATTAAINAALPNGYELSTVDLSGFPTY
jgi:hypothetical protein